MAGRGCCLTRLISLLLSVLVIAGIIVVFLGYDLYHDALEDEPLAEKVADVQADPDYTPIDQIDEDLLVAVVAVEDRRFYEHIGIDAEAMARAIYVNVKELSLSEGGSTITQQLAKNLYFSNEKVFTRKIAEIFMALDIEKAYSKDEILELYLNVILFGGDLYGVREAALAYFDKEPDDLTLEEAAMLAGIPKAPNYYNPLVDYERAVRRQQVVLDIIKEVQAEQ